MSISRFLTLPRRMVGYCTTLVALAILAAPGLAWAQTCNDFGSISKAPDTLVTLNDTVRVTYSFGAAELTPGYRLTAQPEGASQIRVALDCETAFSGGDRESCLGLPIGTTPGLDDGDAITYAGNPSFGSSVGDACNGIDVTVVGHGDGNPPEADPNVVIFQANSTIIFDENERCTVSFDVVVNSIGLPANWEPAEEPGNPNGNQTINAAAGFDGFCTSTLGASATKSFAYTVEIEPEILLKKEVSIDGGTTWFDANDAPFPVGIVPTTTALYRLIVENTGEEPLANVVITDNDAPLFLGLVNVPLPARCYDADGFFPVGGVCTIDSGESGFEGLGNPPVQICQTEGQKTNLACVNGEGAASLLPVESCDPATVVCLEPDLEVTKDGPPLAKVGDEITYTICAENTGSLDLENCQLSDTLLGSPAPTPFAALLVPTETLCNSYPYTILPGALDPLPNTATVTCDVVGAGSSISDSDNHDVNLFEPSIDVTKTGPAEGKVGDEVCYDIGFTNTSSADTPALVNCTGVDSVLGPLEGTFESGVVRQFCREIAAGDPDPLLNRVDITCDVDGFDNRPTDFATHEVDLFTVGAELTKSCATEPIFVPNPISWEICVENTGEKAIDCTINDPVAGIVDGIVTVPAGGTDCSTTATRATTSADVPSVTNTATAVCTVPGYDNVLPPYTATDTCVVDEPGLVVTKDGPPLAKVGDEITYTICAENTGSVDLANCQLSDTLLGSPAPTPFAALIAPGQTECNDYPYTIQPGGPDPLPNTATVTCDVVGAGSSINDSDNHDVNLFEPSIDVTKTGPAEGKVGDEVCYDIGFTNTSSADTPALVNCTGVDSVLGPLEGTFESGVVRQFCREIAAGDPDPLLNRVDITCDVDGFDNRPTDFATHEVDLFTVGAELTKACTPKPTIMVPDPISWEICVENTGEKAIDCTINDPMAGIVDGIVTVSPGGVDCSTTATRATTSADVPSVTNTATAVCTVPGYDNELPPYTATDTCVVDEPGDELCRTPGFWKTHAGIEKSGRSNNLTQEVIDYNGGTLGIICGVEITDTSTYDYVGTGFGTSNGYNSAVEGMCVHPKQRIVRQLQRQLIAAALNCVASGGSADCTGISVGDDWNAANDACVAEADDMSDWVDVIDSFNNGLYPGSGCTDNIQDSRVFENWDGPKIPGPAGSSNACSEATYNDFYLVPLPPGVNP